MVGRLGIVPLAASAFALGIFNVFFIAGIGLVAGVSILAAEAHGANRPREAGEVLRHGLVISVASSLGDDRLAAPRDGPARPPRRAARSCWRRRGLFWC